VCLILVFLCGLKKKHSLEGDLCIFFKKKTSRTTKKINLRRREEGGREKNEDPCIPDHRFKSFSYFHDDSDKIDALSEGETNTATTSGNDGNRLLLRNFGADGQDATQDRAHRTAF
jgi:hypothetical protein